MKKSLCIVLSLFFGSLASCDYREEEHCEGNVAYYYEPSVEQMGEGLKKWDCAKDQMICVFEDNRARCEYPEKVSPQQK